MSSIVSSAKVIPMTEPPIIGACVPVSLWPGRAERPGYEIAPCPECSEPMYLGYRVKASGVPLMCMLCLKRLGLIDPPQLMHTLATGDWHVAVRRPIQDVEPRKEML